MKRRDFLVSSAMTSVGLGATSLSASTPEATSTPQIAGRKILIAGGGFGTAFIRYMASLTGKQLPRICYLPTATADN